VPAIDCDVVLVAEGRNGEIDLRRAIPARLGLGELHRPAGIAVLLAQGVERLMAGRDRD
jgi:hypothetical protein